MAGLFDDLIPAGGSASPPLAVAEPLALQWPKADGFATDPHTGLKYKLAGTQYELVPGQAQTPAVSSSPPPAPTVGISTPPSNEQPSSPPGVSQPASGDLFGDLIPHEQIGSGNAILRGFTNPFGISDEIGGAIQGGVDWAGFGPEGSQGTFSGGYDRFTQRARQLDEEAAAQHPYLYGGGQLASGAAVAAPLAIAGSPVYSATAARALGMGGDTLLGRMGTGMASGAGIGAATGYASGEGGIDNRLTSAGGGALVGGGLGAAAPVVGALVGKTVGAGLKAGEAIKGVATGNTPWRQAASLLGHGGDEPVTVAINPHIIAAKKLAGVVGADRLTPEAAGADQAALLGEHGPNLTEISGGIVARPGEGQTIVRKALQDRQVGATGRIKGVLDRTLGKERDILQTADDISAVQSARAGPAYAAVRGQPIEPSDGLNAVLGTKAGQAAMAKAQSLAEGFGHKFDPKRPTVGMLDYVKRAFDDQISQATRAGARAKAASLSNLRSQLVSEVDSQVPAYAQARQIFAGPAAVKDALEAGQSAFSNDLSPEAMRRTLNDMTASERSAYAIGARAQIAQIMGTARTEPTAAIAVFRKAWNIEKLQTIVGKDHAKALLDTLERERALSNFSNDIIGNSKTAARTAAQKALEDASFMRHTLGTARLAFAVNGIKGVRNIAMTHAVEGLLASHDEARNEQVAAIIARGLAKTGPEKVALIKALMSGVRRMDDIERQSSGAAALVRALTASAVPSATVAAHRASQ